MRELFRVAEEHAPSIVFIDEIDAVGTKRYSVTWHFSIVWVSMYFIICLHWPISYESNSGGEREIQRTMLELLNQLDGFDSRGDVKVVHPVEFSIEGLVNTECHLNVACCAR